MPSSPCASHFTPARRHNFALFGILVLAFGFWACGGSRLTTERAFQELKPKEQLPERELRNLPNNLIIKIDNVADDRESYKNYVVLRINGREIAPIEKISNFSPVYSYPMRLQDGVYEIKAEYHAVGYWLERTFKIEPDEAVKIMPNQRTVLEARLEKNHRGDLEEDPARFRIAYENLAPPPESRIEPFSSSQLMPAAASSNIVVPPLRDADEAYKKTQPSKLPASSTPVPVVPPLVSEPVTTAPDSDTPVNSAMTTLQINTSPAGADVIVDYRYYGQSPVKVTIDKNQNHVIQISLDGYKEVVKILNAADLQNEKVIPYVIKMEAVNAEKKIE